MPPGCRNTASCAPKVGSKHSLFCYVMIWEFTLEKKLIRNIFKNFCVLKVNMQREWTFVLSIAWVFAYEFSWWVVRCPLSLSLTIEIFWLDQIIFNLVFEIIVPVGLPKYLPIVLTYPLNLEPSRLFEKMSRYFIPENSHILIVLMFFSGSHWRLFQWKFVSHSY